MAPYVLLMLPSEAARDDGADRAGNVVEGAAHRRAFLDVVRGTGIAVQVDLRDRLRRADARHAHSLGYEVHGSSCKGETDEKEEHAASYTLMSMILRMTSDPETTMRPATTSTTRPMGFVYSGSM